MARSRREMHPRFCVRRKEALPGLLPAVGRAETVVFSDGHAHHFRRLRQLAVNAVEYEACEVLASGDEFSVTELRHVEIYVAVVEPLPFLVAQNFVEPPQLGDEAGGLVDRAPDGDVTHVGVTVVVWPRTRAEGRGVFLIAPVRSAVAMRGGK